MEHCFGKWIGALALVASLHASPINAQPPPPWSCKILYTYDAAGNRIHREWYCWTGHTPTGQQGGEDAVASEPRSAMEENRLTVLPNPANQLLTVKLKEAVTTGTMEITDAKGQVIQTRPVEGMQMDLDISALSNGAYYVRLVGDQEMLVAVFMVDHE